jgi:hypothetical protein
VGPRSTWLSRTAASVLLFANEVFGFRRQDILGGVAVREIHDLADVSLLLLSRRRDVGSFVRRLAGNPRDEMVLRVDPHLQRP